MRHPTRQNRQTDSSLPPLALPARFHGLTSERNKSRTEQEVTQQQKGVELMQGMRVMTEVKTGKRRVIEYVLSPLLRGVIESGRER